MSVVKIAFGKWGGWEELGRVSKGWNKEIVSKYPLANAGAKFCLLAPFSLYISLREAPNFRPSQNSFLSVKILISVNFRSWLTNLSFEVGCHLFGFVLTDKMFLDKQNFIHENLRLLKVTTKNYTSRINFHLWRFFCLSRPKLDR